MSQIQMIYPNPIIVGSNNPTQALSSLIEKTAKPIVLFLTMYVKDD